MDPALVFQFSPSREGGPVVAEALGLCIIFQFSPSREGGRRGRCMPVGRKNFNSRPRVRAVLQAWLYLLAKVISILALA